MSRFEEYGSLGISTGPDDIPGDAKLTEQEEALKRTAEAEYEAEKAELNKPQLFYENEHVEAVIHGDGRMEVQRTPIGDVSSSSSGDQGGILSTARTADSGMAQSRDQITDDSVVTVTGFGSLRVREAVEVGFLQRDANGRLVEPGKPNGATGRDNNEVENDQDDDGNDTSGEYHTHLNEVTDKVGPEVFQGVAELMVEGAEVPEAYQEAASKAVELGTAIVDRDLADMGVTSDDLVEYASANQEQFQEAIAELNQRGTTEGFKAMATEWLSGLSAGELQQAQLDDGVIIQDRDGVAVIDVPRYGPISFREAVARGFIKVSRRTDV